MSTRFLKTGIVEASGEIQIKDKSGDSITNEYNYAHGFVEDDSDTQAMSILKNYILATEFIEY